MFSFVFQPCGIFVRRGLVCPGRRGGFRRPVHHRESLVRVGEAIWNHEFGLWRRKVGTRVLSGRYCLGLGFVFTKMFLCYFRVGQLRSNWISWPVFLPLKLVRHFGPIGFFLFKKLVGFDICINGWTLFITSRSWPGGWYILCFPPGPS